MIPLHAFDIEHEQLISSIEEKVEHTYLKQYINKPTIDREKLYILINIMNHAKLSDHKKRQYIITIMLVQIALDTHDLVPVSNEELINEKEIITTQLSVLAGDYYSGLYYRLLSEIKELEMIQILASAIKEINEYKMIIYYKEMMTFKEYIHYVEKINARLIIRIAKHFNLLPALQQIISHLLITNKLIEENRSLYNKNASSILNNWLQHSPQSSPVTIYNDVEDIIEKYAKDIEILRVESAVHIKQFDQLIKYFLNEVINKKTSIAEEG